MNIRDLKLGDNVFIREDLDFFPENGEMLYCGYKTKGIVTIAYLSLELFKIKEDDYTYSYEMIDWDKTAELNTFKEITQSGESGNETTKATTYDGKEITVKNNNEENDVEKAVMLLMLKRHGFTYSDIKREGEKVKIKWEPKRDERYYWINEYLEINWNVWEAHPIDKLYLGCGNCFETRKEVEEKLEKIKEVLRGE